MSSLFYTWRKLVVARTPGHCLVCEKRNDLITAGEWMVMIGTGPRGAKDWERAHVRCAMNSPRVIGKLTWSEIRQVTGPKEAIAEYIDGQAKWRDDKAAEYPDDARNERCAKGLRELATYVRSLPEEDERLRKLARLAYDADIGTFMSPSGRVSGAALEQTNYAISRFRFNVPGEDCDQFLSRLVPLLAEDIVEGTILDGVLSIDATDEEKAAYLADVLAD